MECFFTQRAHPPSEMAGSADPAGIPPHADSPSARDVLLGQKENPDARQLVYLITFSRVLADPGMPNSAYKDLQTASRQEISDAVLDSFCNPLQSSAGGRPRNTDDEEPIVKLLVTFKEHHADGSDHFHVAVRLSRQSRFQAVKRTLQQRHRLASHFSCSHTLVWSAVRYGFVASPSKAEVDGSPWVWTPEWSGVAASAGCPVYMPCCLRHRCTCPSADNPPKNLKQVLFCHALPLAGKVELAIASAGCVRVCCLRKNVTTLCGCVSV